MIDLPVTLTPSGGVVLPGHASALALGYTKNRGVYRLSVTASGEWEGLTIRAFWHVPGGSDPASSLVVDGLVGVPSSVTAQPGTGCITFEGSDGTRTVTSADLRYRVAANSGTEDGSLPEPGTPAWQELVDAVHTDATAAEQAKTDAQTAASEAATSAGNAAQSAQEAADSLQELKDGIAAGDFKGEKGDTGPQGPKGDVGPAGADGKDGTQIDDTTVGPDAWSSKHIVDMLCPPLEETGNPVVFYPVADYPLGVTASWEPVQEGSGDPSPDNIRPIKGRDSVKVERCGGNVIEFLRTNDSHESVKIAVDAEKNITLNGALTRGANIIIGMCRLHWVAGKTYTMYVKKVGGSASLGSGDGITFAYSLLTQDYNRYFRGDTRSTNLNAYIASDAALAETELVFMLQCWRANTVFNNFKFQIEVVPGTTAPTTYAPYTGQTATITLPRTIYGGTVDAVTGDAKSEYLKYTVNGTEEFVFNDRADGTQYFSATILQIPNVNDIEESIKTELCSHYPIANPYMVKTACAWLLNQKVNYLRISDPRFSTVEEFKSYLAAQYAAGTPVQVCYKLASPVPITATGAQPIPALSGVNTLMTDTDSVTVTGRADPIKRIIDLEDAVASMTNT